MSASDGRWDVIGIGENSVDSVNLLPGYPQHGVNSVPGRRPFLFLRWSPRTLRTTAKAYPQSKKFLTRRQHLSLQPPAPAGLPDRTQCVTVWNGGRANKKCWALCQEESQESEVRSQESEVGNAGDLVERKRLGCNIQSTAFMLSVF